MVLEAREWGTAHASMKTQVEALALTWKARAVVNRQLEPCGPPTVSLAHSGKLQAYESSMDSS